MHSEKKTLIRPRGHERAAPARDHCRLPMMQGAGAGEQGGRFGPQLMTRRHRGLPGGGLLFDRVRQRLCGRNTILA